MTNPDLLEQIRGRRKSFRCKERTEINLKLRQIQAELVKLKFENKPDIRLCQFFNKQLAKLKNRLSLLN